ncbi:molybdopterin converting factor subunit 1 [Idiomarina sp. ST20R2A10]|uniref:molybdopterin converting factor subunit 1 n=1 Tax=Idiomarina sp. ST20R2A10 TaxID=3418369 RepID=UPI003EC93D8C
MITVKFFAVLRERLGLAETQVDADVNTVQELVQVLKQQSERYTKELDRYQLLCAVNQNLSPLTAEVNDGDEVALFPPVTGG